MDHGLEDARCLVQDLIGRGLAELACVHGSPYSPQFCKPRHTGSVGMVTDFNGVLCRFSVHGRVNVT